MIPYNERVYWNTGAERYGHGFWIKDHAQHRFWKAVIALPLAGSIVWGTIIYAILRFFKLIRSFPIRW